ncbi:DUF5677 domain-containing protein [Amycolatopsis sp. EV170708-02-1]|uniref:DUF5677 domain-containing protein n=1 Tax=Amycolatopsis sp. EV170708-02-1 TaxID=2919322 RepID=UPI001F0BE591|nr:DUF5677 domain-containing protein [Amycolatopsis sp. EV170708-02-1]UMP06755.1 DUF5677 domain-containing protein [Amycolatopsis sp. EV170708-02-1]
MNDSDNTVIADDEATGQRAHEAIAMLTDQFERITEAGEITVNHDTSRLFKALFGWWAKINRSSQLVALAHNNRLGHESGPIVRSIIQHTLVLQWVLDEGDDALDALVEYGEDNTRKLMEDLERAEWPIPPGAEREKPSEPQVPHRLLGMIKNFADLCIAYDARKLYVAYRLLSAQIHPSPQGGMAYVDDTGTLSNYAAKQTWGLLIQTAMCLIQAARTFNPLIEGQPLNDVITRAETRLGTEIGLWTRRQKPSKSTSHRTSSKPNQPSRDV